MSICVFGDSIAWGAYDPANGGWATLLRNYVEREWERFNDKSVYNLAICGETTTTLFPRFEAEFKVREPEIVLIAIGTNDSSNWNIGGDPVVKPQDFQANLLKITEIAKKYTSEIAFVGLSPIDERIAHPFDTENTFVLSQTRQYNQIIKQYCLQHKLIFIEIMSKLTLGDIDDGVHPNTTGHQKIFEVVKPVIEKMLQSN
jgi:lysophospholipase L1-like esterase